MVLIYGKIINALQKSTSLTLQNPEGCAILRLLTTQSPLRYHQNTPLSAMTWKKVALVFLLLCVVGVLFLNHLTMQRQKVRIAALEKQNLDLQAQLEMAHLQDQLNKRAAKPSTPSPAGR